MSSLSSSNLASQITSDSGKLAGPVGTVLSSRSHQRSDIPEKPTAQEYVEVKLKGTVTAWSPVGWVLPGGAAVGGMGLLGYKVFRRWRRSSRHESRAKKGNGSGVVDTESAARKLIAISCSEKLPANQIEIAKAVLGEFNVDAKELTDPKAREAAVAIIVRHAEV